MELLSSLKLGKATGLDNLPSKFLKVGAPHIANSMAHIINLTIRSGKIPSDLKQARVTPLFKKNDRTTPGNYRPVSILSILSKIMEKVIHEQIEQYLQTANLLYSHQFGFRKTYSTDICIMHLTDHIKSKSEEGMMTGMLLLDLQKAFDCVNHKILLHKLEAMGFGKTAISWLQSYLCGRTQCVQLGNVLSESLSVTCGVPQGSILGPILFLCYVNDMISWVSTKLLLYADDSAIIASGKSVNDINNILTSELHSIKNWLVDNKLSLHLGKTETILFGNKRKLRQHPDLRVTCDSQVLSARDSVTYLGVTLDQSLAGNNNVISSLSKIGNKLKFLYRNTKGFDLETKRMIVLALTQGHFDYGSTSWYTGLSKHFRSKLQVAQNKIIRYMLNLGPRAHIGVREFDLVRLLPVDFRVLQLKATYMYNIINNNIPNLFSVSLVRDQGVNIVTRSGSTAVVLPRDRSNTSFVYSASRLWNSLPVDIQCADSKSTFKSKLKFWLSVQYRDTANDNFIYY